MFSLLFPSHSHPLKRVFSDLTDPRISFYDNKLRSEQQKKLLQLRELIFTGTVFDGVRVKLGQNTLIRLPLNDGYGGGGRPAVHENVAGLILQILILKSENKKVSLYTNILREHHNAYVGSQQLLYFAMIALVIYTTVINKAKNSDQIQNTLFKNNVDSGYCVWELNGCSDSYDSKYDCYIPKSNECARGPLTECLNKLVLLSLCVGVYQSLCARTHVVIEIMHDKFNQTQNDVLLDDLCQKGDLDNVDIDWSREIKFSGGTCTIRTLVLGLLVSFDEEMYDIIFSQVLPQFVNHEVIRFNVGGKPFRGVLCPIERAPLLVF